MNDVESVFDLLDRHKDLIIKMNIKLSNHKAISDKLRSKGIEVSKFTVRQWCEMNNIHRKK